MTYHLVSIALISQKQLLLRSQMGSDRTLDISVALDTTDHSSFAPFSG